MTWSTRSPGPSTRTPAPFKKLAWLKKMSWKTATQGIPAPFHKGAARYFQEKGITVRSE